MTPRPPRGADLVAVGDDHTLVARTDGFVWAVGDNSAGQTTVPVLPAGVTYVDIAAGGSHSLALRSDGKLERFGLDGTQAPQWASLGNPPVASPGDPFVGIDCGGLTCLARTESGIVYGWNDNTYDSTARQVMRQDIVQMSAGYEHVAAVRSDGSVISWGGWAGNQAVSPTQAWTFFSAGPAVPIDINTGLPSGGITQVASGNLHTIALKTSGHVFGWGSNQNQRLSGAGSQTYSLLAARVERSLGLTTSGSIEVWGLSTFGPTWDAPLPNSGYIDASLGVNHAIAVRSNGTIETWGPSTNAFGELDVPVLAPGVTYQKVRARAYGNLALLSDGNVLSWGDNTNNENTVPPLPAGTSYIDVEACFDSCMARRSDGEIVVWATTAPRPTRSRRCPHHRPTWSTPASRPVATSARPCSSRTCGWAPAVPAPLGTAR